MSITAKSNPNKTIEQNWLTWQSCVYSLDQNSLTNQFLTLNLDHAFFLMNHQDLRILQETFPKKPPINNGFQNMLTRAFTHYQLIGIKRLRDSDGSSLNGKNAVCSLNAIVSAMKKARHPLTRSRYIQFNTEFIQNEPITASDALALPDPEGRLEEVNAVFDRVSGADREHRSDQDIPLISFFDTLQKKIKETDQVYKIANKISAHLATPENREQALLDAAADAKTLRQAFKDLYLVYSVLDRFLRSQTWRLAMDPLASYARNWTSTNLDRANEKRLRTVYEDMAQETDAWHDHDLPLFWETIHKATMNEYNSQPISKSL